MAFFSLVALLWDREIRNRARRHSEAAPLCWRCDGHACITIFSTADEYAAPCPVCRGPDAYHRRIAQKECGEVPPELAWKWPSQQVQP